MTDSDEQEVDETQVDEQDAALPADTATATAEESVAVQATALAELTEGGGEGAMGLATLMDMPVEVTVEVGRISQSLGELCRLGPGAVLRLDREAHQPADILVNGKVVARGEIVTIEGSYGVRISDVVS
ncbi:MAG: flagellar motor switch protein FliN [Planctomycetota bacterium]